MGFCVCVCARTAVYLVELYWKKKFADRLILSRWFEWNEITWNLEIIKLQSFREVIFSQFPIV
jgi:hypothetical protein